MTTPLDINRVSSPKAGRTRRPYLSVLIPYYKDDPVAALQALSQEAMVDGDIEILIYDDGSSDQTLNQQVCAAVKNAPLAVRLYIANGNRGRSFARNYLKSQAQAEWLLFLDADMRPEHPDFLSRYIDAIKDGDADILFGGFTVPGSTDDPERELHRAFSMTSDCLTVEERAAFGPQYVCSSNLCVRKSVIEAEPFDPEFSGWGWEDSEWAARAGSKFTLAHIDNPALHLGLETTDTLLKRFQTSGPNYKRFTGLHPELAKTLTLYSVVQKIKRLPGHRALRPVLKACVKFNPAPTRLRLFALKLWRASWYAEAF